MQGVAAPEALRLTLLHVLGGLDNFCCVMTVVAHLHGVIVLTHLRQVENENGLQPTSTTIAS